jgi:hypothetical protein
MGGTCVRGENCVHVSRKPSQRPVIVGVDVRIILQYFLEQIQCGVEESSAVVGCVEHDSGTLGYVKIGVS